MKMYEVFEEAKKYLWDGNNKYGCIPGKEEFVCHAIARVETAANLATIIRCRGVIRSRMNNCGTLERWLQVNGHATARQCTSKRMQAYRKRWLDELVREFKEKNT